MQVPFLDLKAQYYSIKDEIGKGLEQVLENTAFAGGPFVEKFEKEFAEFCGCKYSVGVGNGTDALWVAMIGFGIGAGDEVITACNTFIATAEAISYTGATPVFVDVEEATFNMDPAKLEAAITEKTKAIIPVHLYGQMADMNPIIAIAKKHGLKVIEDASQAHGATYNGNHAGSLGDVGCFSFYPGKNLGAYGEAGGIITDNAELAVKMKMFRDHGQSKKYYHDMVGWNARMDGFQGAVLSVKLKHLPAWTAARRSHAERYNELLAGVEGVITPTEASYACHVYHIYAIRVADPFDLQEALKERGVFTAMHYPVPLHLQKAYSFMEKGEGSFPVAEKCASGQISLPMFAELTDDQIEYVADQIKDIMGS